MELSLLLMKQIGVMFVMILLGLIMTRSHVINYESSKVISALSLYLVFPCVIFDSFQIEYSYERLQGLGLALAASLGVHVLYIVMTFLLNKIVPMKPIERASLIYTNAGNLIIPIVAAILGSQWVFYCSSFVAVQTVFVWTHGKILIREAMEFNIEQLLLNTNIIAMILGFTFFITQIPLPSVILKAVSATGSMIGPLSMIITGIVIGNLDLKRVFVNLRAYGVVAARLLVYPSIVTVFLVFSGITNWHPQNGQILFIVLLASAAPSASMITQMAQIYGKNDHLASVINVMSISFCIISMPLITILYQIMG